MTNSSLTLDSVSQEIDEMILDVNAVAEREKFIFNEGVKAGLKVFQEPIDEMLECAASASHIFETILIKEFPSIVIRQARIGTKTIVVEKSRQQNHNLSYAA